MRSMMPNAEIIENVTTVEVIENKSIIEIIENASIIDILKSGDTVEVLEVGTQTVEILNARGEKGEKGDKGDTGPQGPAGADGSDAEVTEVNVRAVVDSVYAPISHSHVISDVTDLQTALDDRISQEYETVSKNLKSYPYTLNYTGSDLTSIVYTLPSGTITKTLNYTSGVLTSVVLSGDTPSGIDLTKTLSYTSGNLTGVVYS